MDSNFKFKIQPAWIIAIDVLCAPVLVVICKTLVDSQFGPALIPYGIISAIFIILVFPLNAKMILGTPAIVLTQEYLVDNIGSRSIAWDNISEIKLVSGFRSFDKIVINLKHPEQYFNTPVRRTLYSIQQLFTANDIGIMVQYISGSSDEILAMMRVYWDKNAGL